MDMATINAILFTKQLSTFISRSVNVVAVVIAGFYSVVSSGDIHCTVCSNSGRFLFSMGQSTP
jgi:hypothetical protein